MRDVFFKILVLWLMVSGLILNIVLALSAIIGN
jgi:hypothetical protein